MALQIRRGTEAEAAAVVFALGELVYTTDTQKLYVGDGITQGGVDILANMEGAVSSVNGQVGVVELDTSNIPENNNLYFTDERAVESVGQDLSRVGATHSGISFVYTGGHIIATVDTGALVGIQDVVDDTSPQLGGSLDLNSFDINGTGDIDITGGLSLTASLTNQDVTLTSNRLTSLVNPPTVSDRSDKAVILGSNANPNTLWVYGDNNFGVFTGISDGTNNAGFTFKISRGTLSAPTTVQAGDAIGFIDAKAHDGTSFVDVGAFGLFADPDGTVSTGVVPGAFGAVVIDELGNQQTMSFNSKGVLSSPTVMVGDGDATNPSIAFTTDGGQDTGFFHPGDGIVCISTNAQERVRVDGGGMRVNGFMKVAQVSGTLPSPAEEGMIVLDGTTFKGYNGSAWVALN